MAGENEKIEKKEGEEKVERKEEKPAQKIELTTEQYNALLDELAELEALRATKSQSLLNQVNVPHEEELDVDKLAREGKGKGKRREVAEEEGELVNLDEMSNTQLAHYIVNQLNEQGGERLNNLEMEVVTLRMLREIDKAEKDHEDFWDYGDQVKKTCVKTGLSVEDAYILAKSKQPAKGKKEGEEEKVTPTRTEKLLKLPPRPHGEKPNVASSSTERTEKGKTLRSAALKAWDEVVGKGKIQIE